MVKYNEKTKKMSQQEGVRSQELCNNNVQEKKTQLPRCKADAASTYTTAAKRNFNSNSPDVSIMRRKNDCS